MSAAEPPGTGSSSNSASGDIAAGLGAAGRVTIQHPRPVPPIPKPAPRPPSGALTGFLLVLLVFGAIITGMAMFGRYGWMMELMSHFRVQYCLLALLLCCLAAICRRWKLAGLALILAGVNAGQFMGIYLPAAQPATTSRTLRLMATNVFLENRDFEQVLQLVEEEQPDFLLVMEVDKDWTAALTQRLADRYPHSRLLPNNGTFGIAFYTKHPVKQLLIEPIDTQHVPAIVVDLEIDGQPLTLIGAHTTSPRFSEQIRQRNGQLRELARLVNSKTGPRMLVGDMNTSPWSPAFADLISDSGLRDSRQGFGIQVSWPTHIPALYIPIDHCLVSPEIAILNRRIGPNIGSDHRPIIVDFAIGKQ